MCITLNFLSQNLIYSCSISENYFKWGIMVNKRFVYTALCILYFLAMITTGVLAMGEISETTE